MSTPRLMTDEQRERFEANGFVVAEQVVPEPFLDGVQQVLERLVDAVIAEWRDAALIDERYDDLAFGSRFHTAWLAAGRPRCATSLDDGARASLFAGHGLGDPIEALAADALDADRVALIDSCHYRAKFPDDESSTIPWHQDGPCLQPIWGVDFVATWIPLVDVSEQTSCLEVSPVRADQELFAPQWSQQAGYVLMGEPDVARLRTTQPVRMRRGDLLLMSPRLPHRTLDNTGSRTRWSVDLRWSAA
jgi:phytanoyl-CoA hydroxylase